MEDAFRFADDLGPEKILYIHNPDVGLKAILVVDNVAAGPSIGGVRMAPDVSTEECFRLARAMTFKNAASGLPCGGGKSVIFSESDIPKARKETLIRAFADAIRHVEDYIPGPDMGTNEECMAWVHDETGRAVGLPAEIGGIPLDEIGATGWGLKVATEVAAEFAEVDLDGARVVIQGFGAVGTHAARFLKASGARIVAVADSGGGVLNQDGLDVEELIPFKHAGNSVTEFDGGRRIDLDELVGVDCEIWIPAARPDAIHVNNVEELKAELIVPGANIGVTDEAEAYLHEHGVIAVPDFIANAGGVICAFVEYQGGTQQQAFDMIEEKIRLNTRHTLRVATDDGIRPRHAAENMARERVETAASIRRSF